MAKSKGKPNDNPVPAKVSGSDLIISRDDPLARFIFRKTDMSLPATITKDTPGVEAIVKSYIVRSDGCNQITNADAARKFLNKNNIGVTK